MDKEGREREFLKGKRILVADDEEYIREYLSKRLKKYGCLVDQADTGEQVLEFVKYHPDLIIMDIKMPVLNGLETFNRLKKNLSIDTIPVILLSALEENKKITRELRVGIDKYLEKPATFQQILEVIQSRIA